MSLADGMDNIPDFILHCISEIIQKGWISNLLHEEVDSVVPRRETMVS